MTWPHTRATLPTARFFFALPVYAGMKNKTGKFCPNKQKKKKTSRRPEKAGTRLVFFFLFRLSG